jgi:hypothetical protein
VFSTGCRQTYGSCFLFATLCICFQLAAQVTEDEKRAIPLEGEPRQQETEPTREIPAMQASFVPRWLALPQRVLHEFLSARPAIHSGRWAALARKVLSVGTSPS